MRQPIEMAAPLTSDALAASFDAALPRIYGYFHHRCEPGAAEELTQETFLAAVAAVRRGSVVHEPLAWLFSIARHKLIDHYRRRSRYRHREVIAWEAWAAADDAPAALVDEPWTAPGWEERTRLALAALPEGQRQALVLRYMDDLSPPVIAAIMDRSVHAVESLLARGRRGFARAYEQEDGR